MSEFQPNNNRSQVLEIGSNTIILDAYNANPSSMQVALKSFEAMKGKRKIVILGDMFELGDISAEEHRKLGSLSMAGSFNEVIYCGEEMHYAHNSNPNSIYFPDKAALENLLRETKFKDSLILIKGSRGMGLESLIDLL